MAAVNRGPKWIPSTLEERLSSWKVWSLAFSSHNLEIAWRNSIKSEKMQTWKFKSSKWETSEILGGGVSVSRSVCRYLHMLSPNVYYHYSWVWFDKSKKSLKMGSGPGWLGLPLVLEDKARWTSWMFNFVGFTDSPHPHKQETRGLDKIQSTSFFLWWLILFFQENSEAKWDL